MSHELTLKELEAEIGSTFNASSPLEELNSNHFHWVYTHKSFRLLLLINNIQ